MELINIKVLNTAIERILNKELAEYDITYTQATVIGFLKHNAEKEICQKDIEVNLGLTHPTVSSILSRMEEKNMVEVHNMSSDKRYKVIRLTDKALEISDDIHLVIQKITSDLLYGVAKDDQVQFAKILNVLISNIEKKL